MTGRTLVHYRVLERLGSGGMGEVYRAHDAKLGRDVALKLLPPNALADEDARRRFRKEAEVLSRLTHPHVASLYDAGSAEDVDFLVMELVPGATLEEELRKGPLAEKEVVRLGAQLARGLAAAHERGVVHRDLKPSNLGLTADGLLKVLDFGVASLERSVRSGQDDKTATQTGPGAVIGSPPYMAPEQLLGKGADARSDLYSAGAVLYELATGARPFGPKRGVELQDAVLHEAPVAPRERNGAITPGLEAVILKALDKDPALRYQSARELLVDLERLQAGATGPTPHAASGSRRTARRYGLTTLGLALVAGGAAWSLWPAPQLRIVGMRSVTPGLHLNTDPYWTSDATHLYFTEWNGDRTRYFQVPIAGGEPLEIPIPFRYGNILDYLPGQGTLLLWGAELETERPGLWLASVPDGGVRRLGELTSAFAAAVSPDERRLALVYGSRPEWQIGLANIDGSGLRELAKAKIWTSSVAWAPDGERLRYLSAGPQGRDNEPWHWETTIRGDAPRPLFPGGRGQWTPDGRHFVYEARESNSRAGSLRRDIWSAPDRPRFPWGSEPARLTVGPLDLFSPGFSPDGRLFAWGDVPRGELLRFDPINARFEPWLGGISAEHVDVSHDGQWVAYVTYPDRELWKSRSDGSERRRLTPAGVWAALPRWSPDGRSVAYAGLAPGDDSLAIRRVREDGGGDEVLVRSESRRHLRDVCWLPDGQSLVYSHISWLHPGVFSFDLRTKRASTLPGAEKLTFPKCSRGGDILAFEQDDERPGQRIRRRGRTDWEPVDLPLVYPNWTRDSEAIVGFNPETRHAERFSLKARTRTKVADLTGMPLVGLDGVPWMGLDSTDSPLVLRDLGVRNLYALQLSTDRRR